MKNLREQIEGLFEAMARKIYNNRFKTVLLALLLFAVCISQIPKITVNTSTEGFLKKTDQSLIDYNEFRQQFGRDELIIIGIEAPEIFNQNFLIKLKEFHNELKNNVPYIKDITSLINARNTRGEGDTLFVEDLLEKWPESHEEMAVLKQRTLSNPLYKNILISEDLKYTTIIIETHNYTSSGSGDNSALDDFEAETAVTQSSKEYLTDEENSKIVLAVGKITEKYNSPGFNISISGSAAISHYLKESIIHDTHKFLRIAVITISIFLFIIFRRLSGVFFPLITVIFSLLSTIGIMGAFGASIKLPTQILPSFILAVGVGDSVHILAIFFRHYRENGSKEEAIVYALGHSGLPVLLTSLTTAGGLLSFTSAKVAPIMDLGIFAATGVLLALFYTLVLLPALISIFPVKRPKIIEQDDKELLMDRVLKGVGKFSTNYPVAILFVTTLLVAVSFVGITRISFSHDVLRWLPENSAIRQATEKMDERLRGTVNLEIIIDTGLENGLHNSELLNRLEKTANYIEKQSYGEIFAGKAWSITNILKEINCALNENRKKEYRIPENNKLISQEFMLFSNSGSDDLEDFTDSQFRQARLIVKVPFRDAVKYTRFLNDISEHFSRDYADVKITLTGMITLYCKTISNAIISLARSYIIAIVVVTILLILMIGNIKTGLLSMIPNLTPIIIMLGIMGWLKLPMNAYTMLVGSIALGLVVDDTIHFMHNFQRYYSKYNNPQKAIEKTLLSAGRAMLITTCVLSLGFFMFMNSSLNHLFAFGFLTGITILTALLADFLVAPALMVIAHREKQEFSPHTEGGAAFQLNE